MIQVVIQVHRILGGGCGGIHGGDSGGFRRHADGPLQFRIRVKHWPLRDLVGCTELVPFGAEQRLGISQCSEMGFEGDCLRIVARRLSLAFFLTSTVQNS